MDSISHDLLVVGGGPAGSCAAALARKAGLGVLVVEREAFPRFHIGESLLPMGNTILRETGVWPKLEAAGFIEKHGARFCLADGAAEKRIDFSRGLVPGLDRTFQVERSRFDALLLEHAASLGAEIRTRTTVKSVQARDGYVEAALEAGGGGGGARVRARWCIDAGGRDNLYPNKLKRELDAPVLPRRTAVYSHFAGLPRPPGPEGGDTIVVRLDDGWFWIIPIDAERTSVGLVTTAAALRAGGRDPAGAFHAAVAASSFLREIFGGARRLMDFHVTADYSYFRRRLASGRIVLAGDAGGFFDPIFSSGVYMAMWSARQAVGLVARAHAAGRGLSPRECAAYARAVKRQAGVFGRLIRSFYDNSSFAIFMSPRPPLDLERGLNSIVAGHARLTWPLRWRFSVFNAVCWLNRRFSFVPPISLPARVADAGAPAR